MTWLDSKPKDVVDAAALALTLDTNPRTLDLLDYCGQDTRFGVWLHLVDKRVNTVLGVGVFDLEDFRWRDLYDAGASPKEAFADFTEELGYE